MMQQKSLIPQDILNIYIWRYIYGDINVYIDRFNALWVKCDKWLEFLWM